MTITRLNPEYAAVNHTHAYLSFTTTRPTGSNAKQIIENAAVNKLYQWADYSASAYSPTGGNGAWAFRLLNTYGNNYTYAVFEAWNSETNKYYTFSYSKNAWAEH